MIGVDVARSLRDAGVRWTPQPGDRFVINAEDLTDQVFWISELIVEVQRLHNGDVLGFNGTTEWALDSIPAADVLWFPWEHQLRSLLGDRFVSLTRGEDGFVVTVADGSRWPGDDAEAAYVAAVLGGSGGG